MLANFTLKEKDRDAQLRLSFSFQLMILTVLMFLSESFFFFLSDHNQAEIEKFYPLVSSFSKNSTAASFLSGVYLSRFQKRHNRGAQNYMANGEGARSLGQMV